MVDCNVFITLAINICWDHVYLATIKVIVRGCIYRSCLGSLPVCLTGKGYGLTSGLTCFFASVFLILSTLLAANINKKLLGENQKAWNFSKQQTFNFNPFSFTIFCMLIFISKKAYRLIFKGIVFFVKGSFFNRIQLIDINFQRAIYDKWRGSYYQIISLCICISVIWLCWLRILICIIVFHFICVCIFSLPFSSSYQTDKFTKDSEHVWEIPLRVVCDCAGFTKDSEHVVSGAMPWTNVCLVPIYL